MCVYAHGQSELCSEGPEACAAAERWLASRQSAGGSGGGRAAASSAVEERPASRRSGGTEAVKRGGRGAAAEPKVRASKPRELTEEQKAIFRAKMCVHEKGVSASPSITRVTSRLSAD